MRNDLADAAVDAVVRRLNDQYVRALLAGDARWFGDHLAADFVCIESDGRVSDRAAFIEMVRGPSELVDYRLLDVDVRCYGGAALVGAHGSWTSRAGTRGFSRYVDVYACTPHGWKVVPHKSRGRRRRGNRDAH